MNLSGRSIAMTTLTTAAAVYRLPVRPLRPGLVAVVIGCLLVLAGCGGGSPPQPAPPPVSISVAPTTVNLLQGATQTFTAAVSNTSNTAVTWSVQEGAAGGTIDTGGRYTAPNAVGTFHVVATSVADGSKTAVASVTVPDVSVVVSPGPTAVNQGASQTFSATVTGHVNSGVTWSVQESAGGSITSAGLYTAPNVAGTFHVVATSQGNPTRSANVAVMIPDVTVTVAPGPMALDQGATQTFSATVAGHVNPGVTWSVQESTGGTISAAGIYVAPNVAGSFHVVATSQGNPARAASVAVTVPDVAVSVAPDTAALLRGQTQSFSAAVTGTVNHNVSWSVQEGSTGGAISSSGQYTAPNAVGTYHIVAASQVNPARVSVATVTVLDAAVQISAYSTAAIPQGGTRRFTAVLQGANAGGPVPVIWSVQEGPTGGAIDAAGLYTAPNHAGTFHIVATSQASPALSATTTVNVPEVAVSGRGDQAMYCLGGALALAAGVYGTVNTAVTWSVQETSGGSITPDGLFTCSVASGTFHVTATSVQDPSKSATMLVTALGAPTSASNNVSIASSLPTSMPQQAIVQGICANVTIVGVADQRVTWNTPLIAPGHPDSLLGCQTYPYTYTAAVPPGTYNVVATSVGDPTKSATWTVNVTALTAIPLSPTNEVLARGEKRTFTATVTATFGNFTRQLPLAVNWTAPGGSIDENGVFTAPATPGTYRVTVSTALPALTAAATVTVADAGYFVPRGAVANISAVDTTTATLLPAGLVFLLGGYSDTLGFSQIYDPGSGTLSAVSAVSSSYRSEHTATLLPDGRVLLAGGFADIICCLAGSGAALSKTAVLYDPVLGTFTPTGDMNSRRGFHSATLLPTGKVLITGGSDTLSTSLATAELYDPATGVFSPTGSMAVARSQHTATLLPNGRVLIAGGAATTATELYDPSTATFAAGPAMTTERIGATATVLPDHTILFAGGTTSSGTALATSEIYDPVSNTFTIAGSMSVARTRHAAALLPNGKVLLVGGSGDRSAELYSPASRSFASTGGSEYLRRVPSLTVLPDGTALLFGGTTTAEIYVPEP